MKGIEINLHDAKACLESAAAKGSIHAHRELGNMNLTGIGTEVDEEKAKYHYGIAAMKGDYLTGQDTVWHTWRRTSLRRFGISLYPHPRDQKVPWMTFYRGTKTILLLLDEPWSKAPFVPISLLRKVLTVCLGNYLKKFLVSSFLATRTPVESLLSDHISRVKSLDSPYRS
jgi:hypothetical protein